MVKDNITYSSVTREDISFSSIVRDGVVIFGSTPTPIGGDTELEYLIVPNKYCQGNFLTTPGSDNYSIEFKYQSIENDNPIGVAGFRGDSGQQFGIGIGPSTAEVAYRRWMYWLDGYSMEEAGAPWNESMFVITLSHNGTSGSSSILYNGSTYSGSCTTSTNLTGTFHLDRGKGSTSDRGCLRGKWYYAKEYLNGTLVHNYVPVIRESDSMVCFKDTISGTYITDTNGQTWTAGPTK